MLALVLVAGHAVCEGKTPGEPGESGHRRGWVVPSYDADRTPDGAVTALDKAKRKKLKQLNVAATDLFYGPSTGVLYATVSAESRRHANTLIDVDPRTRKVLHETPLGGAPSSMSISDADHIAWVILDDARVARVDLLTHRVVSQFTPTLDITPDAIRPITIAAIPGHPETVALSFAFRDHSSDLATALYDDGVRRPALVDNFTALQMIVAGDVIWANRAGYNSGYALLRKLAIRPEGLVWDGRRETYAGNYDVSLENGRFYSTTGQIVDAESRLQVGWIPTGDFRDVAAHAVDLAAGKIYFAYSYDYAFIRVYDLATGRPERYVDGSVYGERPHIRHMVLCGDAGIVTLDDGLTFYPSEIFKSYRPYERPAATPENGQARVIPLPNSYIVYDDVRRKIYATVSPGNAGIGNSIVEVDPYAGTVGRDVIIGSAPGILVLSQDRSLVHVAMWGSYQVKRVRTADFSTEHTISISRGPYAENAEPFQTNAKEILPLPGSSNAMAVLYNSHPWNLESYSEGVAVYDNDVRRPSYTYGGTMPGSLELDDDGQTIYGLNNLDTGADFLKYTVGPGGIYQSANFGSVGTGFYDQLHIAGPRCFTDGGSVIEAATGTWVGRLDFEYENFTSYLAVPDLPRGLVYQLTANDNGFKITSYDIVTFRRVASVQLPPHLSYYVESLLVWDEGRELAFTAGDSIYLVPTSLLKP